MSISSTISGGGGGGSGGGGGGGIGGSTGGADNMLLRSDGTGGATLQSTGILVDDSNAISGQLAARRAGAGGVTLGLADSGKTVSIAAGGGDDDVTLPISPTLGTFFRFAIIATDRLTIHPQGSNVIYIGASVSSTGTLGGMANSNTKGSYLYLEYVAANIWAGTSSGTWTPA